MNIRFVLKSIAEHIPYKIGSVFKYIPFNMRLGREYAYYLHLQREVDTWRQEEKEEYVVSHFSRIFEYAKKHFLFYEALYKKHG